MPSLDVTLISGETAHIKFALEGYKTVEFDYLVPDTDDTVTKTMVLSPTPTPTPTPVTCTDPTPHYSSGCELLLAYDTDNDGNIGDAEVSAASQDYFDDIIAIEELNFINACYKLAAPNINRKCPGCYSAPTPTPMPHTVKVTADSPIPLWYGDESGTARIPCTRENPVKIGMGFLILAADSEYCTIAAPSVDTPGERVIPFSTTITDPRCPATKGTYSGTVTVNGGKGTIHVKLESYPTPTPTPTMIANADFESEGGWSIKRNGPSGYKPHATIKSNNAYKGTYCAEITNVTGSPGNPRSAYIRQSVNLPSDAKKLVCFVATGGDNYGAHRGIRINSTDLDSWSRSTSFGYTRKEYDITNFAGGTITIELFLEDLSEQYAGFHDHDAWIRFDAFEVILTGTVHALSATLGSEGLASPDTATATEKNDTISYLRARYYDICFRDTCSSPTKPEQKRECNDLCRRLRMKLQKK